LYWVADVSLILIRFAYDGLLVGGFAIRSAGKQVAVPNGNVPTIGAEHRGKVEAVTCAAT